MYQRQNNSEAAGNLSNCGQSILLPLEQKKANAMAISKVHEMLDIIERVVKEFDSADNHAHQRSTIELAKNLLKQLNDE